MGKSKSDSQVVVAVHHYDIADSDVVKVANEHGSIAVTLAALEEHLSKGTSMFKVLMHWLARLVQWDVDNDVAEGLRMTAVDAANYICDVVGCQFDAYTLNGERHLYDPASGPREGVSRRFPHIANLVSALRRLDKHGGTLADAANCMTVKALKGWLPQVEDQSTKTELEGVKSIAVEKTQLVNDYIVKELKKRTSKLIKDNGKFASEVRRLLHHYGEVIEEPVIEVKAVVVKK